MVKCNNCKYKKTKFEYKESTGNMILPLSFSNYCELNQPQFNPFFIVEVECEEYEPSSLSDFLERSSTPILDTEKLGLSDIDLSKVLRQSSNSLDLGIERSEEAIDLLSQPTLLSPIPEPYREEYEEKLEGLRNEIEQLREKQTEFARSMTKTLRKVEQLEKKRQKEIKISPEIEKGLPSDVQYIMNQVYSCLEHNLCDACCTMMRKALAAAIDIRFKRDGKASKMYDDSNRRLQLPKMIEVAKQEKYITPSFARKLNQLKWVGDIGAHDYQIKLKRSDVEIDLRTLRMTLERLYPSKKKSRR